MYSTAPVPLFAPCSHSSVSVHFLLGATTGSIAVSFGRTMSKCLSIRPSSMTAPKRRPWTFQRRPSYSLHTTHRALYSGGKRSWLTCFQWTCCIGWVLNRSRCSAVLAPREGDQSPFQQLLGSWSSEYDQAAEDGTNENARTTDHSSQTRWSRLLPISIA